MKLKKECSTCRFNFSGTCCGHGDKYQYGDQITDITRCCNYWVACLEYFTAIMHEAPWYIKESYSECKIDYNEFVKLIERDEAREPIRVNIYDAIQRIYGLSLTQLAEILNVTIGIITHAKNRGTPATRVIDFSNKLCIPRHFFNEVTTAEFIEIEKCKTEFFSGYKENILLNIPQWKEQLIKEVMSFFNCSSQLASEIAMISNFKWELSDERKFNKYEQALFDYINVKRKEGSSLISLEYKLNALCKPSLEYKLKD